MNEKCKYCDYVSKCSRKCEYGSILCLTQRSFPKIVDKSYEELQQENEQLKGNWNKLKEYIQKDYDFYDKLIAPEYGCAMGALSRIKDEMQEIEESDSNE